MYGFSGLKNDELTIQNISKKVSDIVLWRYYLGVPFQVNKVFHAPYRHDNKPSFALKYDYAGRLVYKDFSTGEYGDIYQYLQNREAGMSFTEALAKINADFRLGLGNNDLQVGSFIVPSMRRELIKFEKDFIYTKANTALFEFEPRRYNRLDMDYWTGKYDLQFSTLAKYNVYAANKLYVNGRCVYTYNSEYPCYVYHFPVTGHMKCYFPKGNKKGDRFLGNVNNYQDIQGYYQCDVKGERDNKFLILTKSMKDVMLLHELGYDAMAINGEGHYFYTDFIRHIKKYYPIIISLYDPDKSGIKGAKYLWKNDGIAPYFIPRKYRSETCKDISDINSVYKRRTAEEVVEGIKFNIFSLKNRS